ncbi:hypothetical protein [Allokutzneria sp. NRRL B-24872]|uniref:hypothetical protein n=1 Tax=Allokutzneria sp. NRRL B-24872 TaxID=1137961 RepID=UPI000A38836D|nr:hypothetical protein [Allokutzneria sp. NRRL B-24872]
MARVSRSLLTGAAVAAALAGGLVIAPASAFAYPTNQVYATQAKCEKAAALIRQGSVGAWCQSERVGRPPLQATVWRVHTTG